MLQGLPPRGHSVPKPGRGCRPKHEDADVPKETLPGLPLTPFSAGRSPTHLLELRVDELQPIGVNLVQVIAAAPWPIRLGALTKFGAARGHLGRGAFQRWEDPRKSREGVVRGGTLSLLPLLGLGASASSELAGPAENLVGK